MIHDDDLRSKLKQFEQKAELQFDGLAFESDEDLVLDEDIDFFGDERELEDVLSNIELKW